MEVDRKYVTTKLLIKWRRTELGAIKLLDKSKQLLSW